MRWPQKVSLNVHLLVYHAILSEVELSRLERMAGTTGLEPATSAVTGQRSNQLNYVPNRGINNLAQNPANKAFARFAYSALFAWIAYSSSCPCQNRP